MERSLAELEMALAEAVHRAKNDLQAVTAMLRLQASAVTQPVVRAALIDAEARVHALASLNARLDAGAQGVESMIDSVIFLEGLATDIRGMHFGEQRPVVLDVRAESHRIATLQGKPLGLILNELVVNALKYAFPDGRHGTVRIDFQCRDGEYVLAVTDDGIGFDLAAPPQGTGLGKRLVRALTAQIGGVSDIRSGKDGGTICTIRWPAAGPNA
jgi:two-component sensor histidine kinase